MKSIDLTPLYRSSIGFDRLASSIDKALEVESNGHPPYDIEIVDDNHYTVTLAVAGFIEKDLAIQVDNGVLSIIGNKPVIKKGTLLHKGIANKKFERKFDLADYVEITNAKLANGLLTINLVKEIPEAMKPRSIPIHTDDQVAHSTQEIEMKNSKGMAA
jgi:molecular chaperone IbpA